MRRLLLGAVLGAAACAIEYRVPASAESSGSDDGGSTPDLGDECEPPQAACNGECVDLESDPNHCGDCTEQCDPGGFCNAGNCVDACGDACDDALEICSDGSCVCRTGFVECDGVCVDLETDPEHCGQCDRDCGGDPCGAGECQPAGCGDFPDRCGDSCTDVQSDPLHCRECDRPCKGDETCVEGDCEDIG